MSTKKTISLLLLCCLIVSWGCGALASGLNITSQFYNGNTWPNRQSSACKKSSCSRARQCTTCSPKATPKPTPAPTRKPTPAPSKPPVTDGHYTIGSASAQESEALKYINEDRALQGLPALVMDKTLCALARMKSQDMLSNNYFAHTSPTLGDAAAMLRNNGYSFRSVGENISKHSTVSKSHAALMNSDGHRRNILGSSWQKVGIGIVQDKNGSVYMTQLFVR